MSPKTRGGLINAGKQNEGNPSSGLQPRRPRGRPPGSGAASRRGSGGLSTSEGQEGLPIPQNEEVQQGCVPPANVLPQLRNDIYTIVEAAVSAAMVGLAARGGNHRGSGQRGAQYRGGVHRDGVQRRGIQRGGIQRGGFQRGGVHRGRGYPGGHQRGGTWYHRGWGNGGFAAAGWGRFGQGRGRPRGCGPRPY